MTSSSGTRSTLRLALVVAGVLLVALQVRATLESRRYFELGVAAETAGQVDDAVVHLRHAAQWHAPVLSRSRAAVERLIAIGDEAGERADVDAALVAWRAARAAVLATRHLWTPHADLLPGLHARIGAAMMRRLERDDPEAAREEGVSAAAFTAELDAWRSRQPTPALALLASLAFLAWVGLLALLAWRGFDERGRVRIAFALRAGAASVVALAVWLAAVRLA